MMAKKNLIHRGRANPIDPVEEDEAEAPKEPKPKKTVRRRKEK